MLCLCIGTPHNPCHACRMYIRCTTIKSKQAGEPYKTYRLVETERVGAKVKQRIVLNLGRHFEVPQAQ